MIATTVDIAEELGLLRDAPGHETETPWQREQRLKRTHELQAELIKRFCRKHGWARTRTRTDIKMEWLGMAEPWVHHLFDHTYCLRHATRRRHYAIATHPYNVNPEYERLAQQVADEYGLLVEYPDFPSWYYPGRTTLVLWTKDPLAKMRQQQKPPADTRTLTALGAPTGDA
jgi:hypothetical protein